MNLRCVLACVVVCSAAAWSRSAEPAAAPAASPAPSASPTPAAPTGVEAELQALVTRTKAKIAAGARTEAALADELKGFDALLAAHHGEKSETLASVLFLKAALYLQIFGQVDKGAELLKQVKADYPGTQSAKAVDQVLAQVDQEKESLKLQAALQPGAAFPNFTEKDLAGQPLSIAQFKGKVLLVDFWATWCGPCVGELPNVLAAYQKYHEKGFEIVGISFDRSEDALKSFLKAHGVPWAQYFDGKAWDSKLGRQYGITSIPATFLLDRDGKIVARDLRGEELSTQLAKLLP